MEKYDKGTGIVCEYNPFHKGHAYQIERVKEMGAQFVVCAMSGDFTQRAEAAFQDKHIRAENAVKCGADIVLEIPFPFSSLSAEGFAKAGISILENSGLCSSFAFGSECADTEKLSAIAGVLDDNFRKEALLLQKNAPNLSYAQARQTLITQKLGKEYANIIKNPNDILAVEYLRANTTLCPIAVKRKTPRGGYDEDFVSSSYIRNHLPLNDDCGRARCGIPENCSLENVHADDTAFYNHVLLSLMQKNPRELSGILEVQEGCEFSIIKNALKAENYGDLCRLMSSKTMTDAKIRRMLMFSFFGVTPKAANRGPLYTEVLGISEKGGKMLKKYAHDRKIVIASRAGDIKKDEEAKRQYDFARRAQEVLEKCRKIMQ